MSQILGIDEAGRGAWAGPLVVGAVILGQQQINGLTDSKLISPNLRQQFADLLYADSLFTGLGWVSSKEVDRLGLTAATKLGIKRAIKDVKADIYSEIIIDGNINYLTNNPVSRCVIKADLSVPAVSAASIIAKVARDDYMKKIAARFPSYGFANHVGYGTKVHSEKINEHGLCEEHRISFKPVSAFV